MPQDKQQLTDEELAKKYGSPAAGESNATGSSTGLTDDELAKKYDVATDKNQILNTSKARNQQPTEFEKAQKFNIFAHGQPGAASNIDLATHTLGQGWQGIKDIATGTYGMGKDILFPEGHTEGERLKFLANKYIQEPYREEQQKADNSSTTSESFGHGLASVIPFVGPFAASLGEQAGTGDVLGATGRAAGTMVGGELLNKGLKGAENVLDRATPTIKVPEGAIKNLPGTPFSIARPQFFGGEIPSGPDVMKAGAVKPDETAVPVNPEPIFPKSSMMEAAGALKDRITSPTIADSLAQQAKPGDVFTRSLGSTSVKYDDADSLLAKKATADVYDKDTAAARAAYDDTLTKQKATDKDTIDKATTTHNNTVQSAEQEYKDSQIAAKHIHDVAEAHLSKGTLKDWGAAVLKLGGAAGGLVTSAFAGKYVGEKFTNAASAIADLLSSSGKKIKVTPINAGPWLETLFKTVSDIPTNLLTDSANVNKKITSANLNQILNKRVAEARAQKIAKTRESQTALKQLKADTAENYKQLEQIEATKLKSIQDTAQTKGQFENAAVRPFGFSEDIQNPGQLFRKTFPALRDAMKSKGVNINLKTLTFENAAKLAEIARIQIQQQIARDFSKPGLHPAEMEAKTVLNSQIHDLITFKELMEQNIKHGQSRVPESWKKTLALSTAKNIALPAVGAAIGHFTGLGTGLGAGLGVLGDLGLGTFPGLKEAATPAPHSLLRKAFRDQASMPTPRLDESINPMPREFPEFTNFMTGPNRGAAAAGAKKDADAFARKHGLKR